MNKKVKKGLDILSIVLLIVIFILGIAIMSLSLTRNKDGVPRLFGSTFLSIQSDSMVGKKDGCFNRGDVVVITQVEKEADLKIGDVVTFKFIKDGNPALNTHRIVEFVDKTADGEPMARRYITKGDNVGENDIGSIGFGDIIGKYSFKIPFAGYFVDFLSSFWGFFCIIIIPLGAFLIYRIIMLVKVVLDMKREKEKGVNGDDTLALQAEIAALRERVALLSDDIGAAKNAEPEMVVSEPEMVVSEPEMAVSEPETIVSEPERIVSEPEMVVSEPEMAVSEPEMVVSEPEMVASEPEMAVSEPKMVVSEPEMVAKIDEPIENVITPTAIVKKPVAKKTTTTTKKTTTATKSTAAKKPVAKKATTTKKTTTATKATATTKKPVAKKPVAKKPVAKKTTTATKPKPKE